MLHGFSPATAIGTVMETRITKPTPNKGLEHGSWGRRWIQQGRREFRVGRRDLGTQIRSRIELCVILGCFSRPLVLHARTNSNTPQNTMEILNLVHIAEARFGLCLARC